MTWPLWIPLALSLCAAAAAVCVLAILYAEGEREAIDRREVETDA